MWQSGFSESTSDSENPSGGVYLHRDKNKIARSADLEASSGRGDCQGGRERLRNSSPSPLDEKNTKPDEVLESKEVKAQDSKIIDSGTTWHSSKAQDNNDNGAVFLSENEGFTRRGEGVT